MNHLIISHLNKTYRNGIKAIDNISLDISNGMFGLLGPNGAGKSSLMKTIVGLQKPDNGHISFNGKDILKDPAFIKRQLGFLPQDFGVYTKATAWQLLNHLAVLKGVADRKQREQQILSLLDKVNLLSQKNKEVFRFSGGMKQRFGVAQALLGDPKIIIVDEPTAGLDPEERNRFNNLLSEIGEDIIVLLSTHLVEDVRNLCSRMAILQNGYIRVTGRPADLVQVLQGKIFNKKIDRSQLEKYMKDHLVLSRQLIEKSIYITVYAEKQPEGFEPVSPTLEHVYFKTLHNPNQL